MFSFARVAAYEKRLHCSNFLGAGKSRAAEAVTLPVVWLERAAYETGAGAAAVALVGCYLREDQVYYSRRNTEIGSMRVMRLTAKYPARSATLASIALSSTRRIGSFGRVS